MQVHDGDDVQCVGVDPLDRRIGEASEANFARLSVKPAGERGLAFISARATSAAATNRSPRSSSMLP
jgi:hypothetical protein